MEKKREEMTLEDNIEFSALVRDQVCAVCGGDLIIEGVRETDSMRIVCKASAEHTGFRQRDSAKTDLRRGKEVALDIRNKIETTMMVKSELHRAMNLLQMRYPDSIKDIAGASLFINDCMRLGLDPLIQPAEAVPIAFNTKDKAGHEKKTVAMIVTEDGWLSMCARGCPEEYEGAPATMPLLDYLMREHPQRPLVELQEVAKRTAAELCDDPAAFVWVALGKRRSATVINQVYGYYRQAEWQFAKSKGLPAGTQPGNQARVRGIKRWARENFPECRQKILAYTAALLRRSEGAIEAQSFIDAEYRVIIDTTDEKPTLISPPGQKAAGATKTARTKTANKADNKVGESAKRPPVPGDGGQGDKSTAAPSGAAEHTLLLDQKSPEMAISREASAAGEGFRIPLDWHSETLNTIKWSWDTARSWIAQKFPGVNAEGSPADVLSRLTRDQADIYTKELQDRADRVQPKLFK